MFSRRAPRAVLYAGALLLGYVGSIGPTTALLVAPESWGIGTLQASVVGKYYNVAATPIAIACENVPIMADVLGPYQEGWASLTEEVDVEPIANVSTTTVVRGGFTYTVEQ